MIGYLKGSIVFVDPTYLIVNVGGIGYEVKYNNQLTSQALASDIELFVTHTINEFAQGLYGFDTIEEKLLFEKLTSIKGVGNKAIFQIMSGLSVKSFSDLKSIRVEDLVKINGIGKTIAQKILLGISQKIKNDIDVQDLVKTSDNSVKYQDVFRSLTPLGISESVIKSILAESKDAVRNLDNESLVKFILRKIKQ